ncbi:MAG: hypothetical protein KBC64_04845 [Simkaniaceae bacterium]|nr:hypothetical protein [Simkaniaceae bacterium]
MNLKSFLKKLFKIHQFHHTEKPLKLKENLSTLRPHPTLPSTLIKRSFENQTVIYTYQPPRPYVSPFRPLNESLIKESLEEKLHKVEENQRLLTFARLHLPLRGVLKRNEGHYYLEISPQFSRSFPYGKSSTYQQRVTVIYTQEGIVESFPEEGMMFSFTLKGYYRTKPVNWPTIKTAYLLLIEVPALEELRVKHHLSPKPYGHDFHLLLSVDPSLDDTEESNYYRVSVLNHSV